MSVFQVNLYSCVNNNAGVAELADALDLGSSAARRAGSIPVTRIRELCILWGIWYGIGILEYLELPT